MWKNGKGSLVLELAISLVILSMFVITVFPIIHYINLQHHQKQLELTAKTVLYEQMLKNYLSGSHERIVTRNNKEFEIEQLEGEFCAKTSKISICLPSWIE